MHKIIVFDFSVTSVNALKERRIVNPIESNFILNRIVLNLQKSLLNRFAVYPKIHSSSLQSLDRPKTLPASQCAYYPSLFYV